MKSYTGLFDKAGIAASSLCMLHCIGTLLLAFLLPATGIALFANESVHATLAFVVLGAGLFAFVPGYNTHRKSIVLLIAIIGISLILAPHIVSEKYVTENLETVLTLFGGGIVVFAHWKNRVYCKACQNKPFSCSAVCNECNNK